MVSTLALAIIKDYDDDVPKEVIVYELATNNALSIHELNTEIKEKEKLKDKLKDEEETVYVFNIKEDLLITKTYEKIK